MPANVRSARDTSSMFAASARAAREKAACTIMSASACPGVGESHCQRARSARGCEGRINPLRVLWFSLEPFLRERASFRRELFDAGAHIRAQLQLRVREVADVTQLTERLAVVIEDRCRQNLPRIRRTDARRLREPQRLGR